MRITPTVHQDSVESSDEGSPDSTSPSPDPLSISYPTAALHGLSRERTTSPSLALKKEKKKKKKSFLFLRKKKRSSTGPLELAGPLSNSGSLESAGSSSWSEFAEVLVDPSLIRRTSRPGSYLSAPIFGRSASDSAVSGPVSRAVRCIE